MGNLAKFLEKVNIPGCFKMPETCEASYELQHFCDASLVAYGSVAYSRSVNKSGNFHVAFLMGKGHLSPKPSTTVPRLELLAAVTAVRLDRLLHCYDASYHFQLINRCFGQIPLPFLKASATTKKDFLYL